MAEATFWNGEPTPCRKVLVEVGTVPLETWWCHGLTGTIREAVLVEYGDMRYLLDNQEDHDGWAKVTTHRGSPRAESWHLPDDSRIVGDSPDYADEIIKSLAAALAAEFKFIGGGAVEAAPEMWERSARGILLKMNATQFTVDENPEALCLWITNKERF